MNSNNNIQILLVDDSSIVRMVIAKQLQKLGYVVDTAADGLLAVEAVRDKEYDLIFMDVMMPNLDGMEATRRIRSMRKDDGKRQPKIAGVTGYTSKNDCIAAGMDDFLFKPVTVDQLREAITRLIPESSLNFGVAEEKIGNIL